MIVIGHYKRTHTLAAVFDGNGQVAGQMTVAAREAAYHGLLARATGRRRADPGDRGLSPRIGRPRALPGRCRRGVVRAPPKMMGESRAGERFSGKSDPIDATAIAGAALREGPESLPPSYLDEDAREMKLLFDHREDPVCAR